MTNDINDVRHTSTYAKAEDAIRRDERSRISPVSETVTNRQLHDVIANAISKGRTYSGIQEAVREIQKLYAGHAQTEKQQIKDAFYAGYWAWFGPATKQELDRGCSELDESWLEYEAALSDTSTDRTSK